MADKNKIKIRCSICGDGVPVEGKHVAEHNHRYTGAKVVCYGSFLPVLMDGKGQYQVGTIMYISRPRAPWDGDED